MIIVEQVIIYVQYDAGLVDIFQVQPYVFLKILSRYCANVCELVMILQTLVSIILSLIYFIRLKRTVTFHDKLN